jgi:hypothetical protein
MPKSMYDILLDILTRNGMKLEHIPKHEIKEIHVVAAVRNTGLAIRYAPIINMRICSFAVSQNGLALQYVPKKYRTDKICMIAVKQNGLALEFVIKQTKEICLIAVKQNPLSICYMNISIKDNAKLCEELISTNPSVYCLLPKRYQTEELAYKTALKDPDIINYTPWTTSLSERMDIIAVKSGYSFVGVKNKTIKVCHEAVSRDGLNLQHVPKELRTDDISETAVKQNGLAIKFVNGCTRKIMTIAVRQNPDVIEYITTFYTVHEDITYEAILKKPSLFKCIPKKYRTQRVCYAALCDHSIETLWASTSICLQHFSNGRQKA